MIKKRSGPSKKTNEDEELAALLKENSSQTQKEVANVNEAAMSKRLHGMKMIQIEENRVSHKVIEANICKSFNGFQLFACKIQKMA